MSGEIALMIALGAPLIQAVQVLAMSRPPGLRDVVHIAFSAATAGAAVFIVHAVSAGESARIVLAQPLPGVELAFAIEPLGAVIGCLIAGLGVLNAVHTAGYARAAQERAPARMMAWIALSTSAALGAAYSANLLTFFICGQVLVLSTFPLVAFSGDDAARKAARIYLATLLAASISLFLPAMIWTYAKAGTLDFRVGGVLTGRVDPVLANVLLVLFMLGLAKTALPPLHRWLFVSTRAPFPALVLIQAIAVAPVGAAGVLKITAYIFGSALHEARFAALGLLILAGASMCYAALIALAKQDLRERMAYATMAQSMAIVLGALLALPAGTVAAVLQVVAFSCAATTLLMAGGAAFAATGRTLASEYHGLGRLMPWTMAGFALGAASLIGMPPFSGAWAKLWLITASADAGLVWAAVLVGAAAIMTFAAFAPLAANALIGPAPADAFKRPDGASFMLVAPVVLSAAATLWLLVLADPIAWFLAPLWSAPP